MSDLTAWIPGALESFGAALVHRMDLVNLWTAALLVGALVLDRALEQCTRASLRIAHYAPVALRVLLPLDWTAGLPHARVATVLAPLATIGATSGTTAPAHLRRRDAWLLALMQLLSVVAWPVVPLWIAIARVRQLLELARDPAAVAGADDAERRRYGRALLDVAEWQSFAVAPLGAGELRFGSTLRARIEALASFEHDSASRATSPVSTAAASTPSDAPAPGRLPPEAIQAVVRSHFAMFQGCYEAGLKKDPTLRGTVSVEYVIGEDGTTRETNGDASTLPDKDVVPKTP